MTGFRFEPSLSGVEISLVTPTGLLPFERWSIDAPEEFLRGVDVAHRLLAADKAVVDVDRILVEHQTVAALTSRESAAIGLPAPIEFIAHIQTTGIVTQPTFGVALRWLRPNGQAVIGVERTGAFLRTGGEWRRVPEPLFSLVESVDEANSTSANADPGARLTAIAKLKEALPDAAGSGGATATGILDTMTIAVADAFSLDMEGDQLVPILHGSKANDEGALLPPDRQAAFGGKQFRNFAGVRSTYSLGGAFYVVLSPPLRRALSVVRDAQSAPIARRLALFANPRGFLQSAFGEEESESAIETVFRETNSYAARVLGIGLWKPRVVPWIKLPGTNWFEEEAPGERQTDRPGKAPSGIMVGDRAVPLSEGQVAPLVAEVKGAIADGRPSVPFDVDGERILIPAHQETVDALLFLEQAKRKQPSGDAKNTKPEEGLLIAPNEMEVAIEGEVASRTAYPPTVPGTLVTSLKAHQEEGLQWLQKAWSIGRPGVLLADDMGLGKTIQGLAFLAWLREGMRKGVIPKRPFLVVAPTGLLRNWLAEHDRHLRSPGLGTCIEGFGGGLSRLRRVDQDGRPGLDTDRLAAADWVLTTYETLRNFDRDFGAVRFAVVLLDEAQKVKTPGIRLTDAAKAMNADFRIAMTGTPVENRLSDLWCITDTIHPALLGDLRSFSARYERDLNRDRLVELKHSLDSWQGGRPPILLRRLKKDRLPDIPAPEECLAREPMPEAQCKAYERVIENARRARAEALGGSVLSALHELRKISLHPDRETPASDEGFIAASARLTVTFQVLDKICAKREPEPECALLFLNDLDMQARLVGLIQRRYRLRRPPMVINGTVAGADRQARVDRFQSGPKEFDVMILSPQAGGVGLTLTRANHVIHLARWWNPAVEDQCTGRALRIGQEKTVYVHIPMATLTDGRSSFDENLHALLERKRQLMNEALMPPEPTEGDLDELLRASI